MGDLCERFGWTFNELEEEDESRVMRAVMLMNIRDSLRRVQRSMEQHVLPAESDLEVWGMVYNNA